MTELVEWFTWAMREVHRRNSFTSARLCEDAQDVDHVTAHVVVEVVKDPHTPTNRRREGSRAQIFSQYSSQGRGHASSSSA